MCRSRWGRLSRDPGYSERRWRASVRQLSNLWFAAASATTRAFARLRASFRGCRRAARRNGSSRACGGPAGTRASRWRPASTTTGTVNTGTGGSSTQSCLPGSYCRVSGSGATGGATTRAWATAKGPTGSRLAAPPVSRSMLCVMKRLIAALVVLTLAAGVAVATAGSTSEPILTGPNPFNAKGFGEVKPRTRISSQAAIQRALSAAFTGSRGAASSPWGTA